MRGERKNYFLLSCLIFFFLSGKIHLELLQCSLDQENYYSNFKKNFEKVFLLENLLELIFECTQKKEKKKKSLTKLLEIL